MIKEGQFKHVKYGYHVLSVSISDVVVCHYRLLIVALLTLPYLSIILDNCSYETINTSKNWMNLLLPISETVGASRKLRYQMK